MRAAILLLLASLLPAGLAGRGQAHDMPASLPVTGFFDYTDQRPELVLRVPLIMLTNVNLPKRGPGYIDLGRIDEARARAERAVAAGFRIWTGGGPLEPVAVESRIRPPSDRSFETSETAAASVTGPPVPQATNVFWNQGFFDVRLVFAPQAAGADYTLRTDLPPGMDERTLISIGVLAPDGAARTLTFDGTTAVIALDPSWYQAGSMFFGKGVEHILTGYDHLLFLLCLILPLWRDTRRLFGVVTAFTVGHSATLIPAALGMVPAAAWFAPGVEALIALSIVWMAAENVLGAGTRFRWGLAFGFGLIHGFGFASTLGDVMQFAGGHLVVSLVFFNVGIEAGQVLVLALVLPLLALVLRDGRRQRWGVILISVLAGHEGWHWMTERAGQIDWTGLRAAAGPERLPSVTWLGAALILGLGLAWALAANRRRKPGGGAP